VASSSPCTVGGATRILTVCIWLPPLRDPRRPSRPSRTPRCGGGALGLGPTAVAAAGDGRQQLDSGSGWTRTMTVMTWGLAGYHRTRPASGAFFAHCRDDAVAIGAAAAV